MKKSLLFYSAGPILLLVGACCVGLLLPFEMRAATKNVWIEYEVDTHESPQDMTVCIGQEKLFTAETAHPPGSSWSWSGATISGSPTSHPTSDALKTFSTAGGPFSVTATYNSETSHAARVTVVEVASLTPSEGTLISGSSPPTYVVCLGTGDVTVTATPNPSVAEGSLPSCWGFTSSPGGVPIGLGLLQRKITKSTPSTTTFTAGAGTSSKSIVVKVIEVASITPDKGTFGGWGPPPIYVVCIGNGTVTIRATANPSATASELPSCWTLTSDSSSVTIVDKLTATMNTDTPTVGPTITATAGTSSKAVKVQVKCPDESIEMVASYCCSGGVGGYGGLAYYCYSCASNALWWQETVSITSDSCNAGPLGPLPPPFQMTNPINCAWDLITNPCPIPASSCQTVTSQTVLVGTSQTSLTCSYFNTHTITVTVTPGTTHGTITTSVTRTGYNGDSKSCNF